MAHDGAVEQMTTKPGSSIVALTALWLLAGCAFKDVEQLSRSNITLAAEAVAVVGAPFIVQETGSVRTQTSTGKAFTASFTSATSIGRE
jgi:uncharacterized lipoprotein YajG